MDVWTLMLIPRERWNGDRFDPLELEGAIARLARMAPALASLDRTHVHAELYISTIRDEDMGTLWLSAELLQVAAKAELELVISILADLF